MTISAQAKTVLQEQTISENGPGTVLRDFETLLDFVGTDGLASGGKYHLLPMSRLPELDEQMTRPLRPGLKRPQQHSYPHIHGLFLLLRSSGLCIHRGQGSKGRLLIDPEMLEQWRDLNLTERYFNLLETWMLHAEETILGERGGFGRDVPTTSLQVWQRVPPKGLLFGNEDPWVTLATCGLFGKRNLYHLALLESFGLMDVASDDSEPGQNWRITAIRHNAFGDALLEWITAEAIESIFHRGFRGDEQDEGPFGEHVFGYWQLALQQYFPDWQKNLLIEGPEFREGLYVFKVSLGTSCWRQIAIPAAADCEELAWAIIDAFCFDGDHLYAFSLRSRDGRPLEIACGGEPDAFTNEVRVGSLPLDEGDTMTFVYDFGAEWQFTLKLERIESPEARRTKPQVVASHGEAPEEYPDFW